MAKGLILIGNKNSFPMDIELGGLVMQQCAALRNNPSVESEKRNWYKPGYGKIRTVAIDKERPYRQDLKMWRWSVM